MFIVFIISTLLLTAIISFIVWIFHKDPVSNITFERVDPIFPEDVKPLHEKSSHLKMEVMSQEHREYMSQILGLTKLWFQWAKVNNVRSSLQGGSVIGYVIGGGILPHDDDIDVSLHHEDLPKLDALYKAGKKQKVRLINNLFWDVRETIISPMNIVMRIAKARRYNGWYKWLPEETYHPIDIGGLDIMTAVPHSTGIWYEMAKRNRRLPSQENLIPITFNGFSAYIAQDEEVFEYLKERYGTRWISEITEHSPYANKLID